MVPRFSAPRLRAAQRIPPTAAFKLPLLNMGLWFWERSQNVAALSNHAIPRASSSTRTTSEGGVG